MSDSRLRLYTDEDISWRLAVVLAERGYDVLSCHAAGNADQGLSDEWQLGFATEQGRVILSHNTRDCVPLAIAWYMAGREHAGIIVAPRMSFSRLIEQTARHLDSHDPDVHYNILIHLGESPPSPATSLP